MMIEVLETLHRKGLLQFPGGVPMSLIRGTHQQWDYPNGFAPINHMVIEGLRKSNHPIMQQKAFEIASRWINRNYRVYMNEHKLWQKYDVAKDYLRVAKGGEYDNQPGFGWTNGALLDLLVTYSKRIRVVNTDTAAAYQSVPGSADVETTPITRSPLSSITLSKIIVKSFKRFLAAILKCNMSGVSFRVDAEYAKITEIVPGLFICGVIELNAENMAKHQITHIINATDEVPNLRSLGNIQRCKLWLEDTPQTYIYPHLELQSDQIEALLSDGGKVLVHCVAGVSRSASICLAYLTKYRCRSLRDAYDLMAEKRPLVRPNIGFWRQLIAFEQEIKKCHGSVRLVQDEAQEDKLVPDVYLRTTIAQPKKSVGERKKRALNGKRVSSSISKLRFQPILETLPELVEAAA
ncbi:Dual specificity protein phosphatase 14 [Toxocara canis]|uniref:Trehalase n=1 Tax=Toxocara canis TaxID=6265 RepID=A0A0B2VUM1_TOXCA|nr:Dual specificity protein phosphatase 14 [Toxocara canis]